MPRHTLHLLLTLLLTSALATSCARSAKPTAIAPPPEELAEPELDPDAIARQERELRELREREQAAEEAREAALQAERDAAQQAARHAALNTPKDPLTLLNDPASRGPRDLVLVHVGDVSQPTKSWPDVTRSMKTKAFAPTQHLLDRGDLVAMNLENPVSEINPTAKKTYSFTSHPERLGWYFDVGFNLFSLSNNHIADAAQPGIDDTLRYLTEQRSARNVQAWWAGVGTSYAEGEAPIIFTPEGKALTIAFFSTGFSKSPNASKFWSESLIKRIREAKKQADLVIISVHAGKEYQHIPEAAIQERFRSWIDAGADVVIGHHPHVIQPAEVYKSGVILYSLGNYVFASRTVRHRQFNARLYGLLASVVIRDGKPVLAELTPLWSNSSEDWVLETGERLKRIDFNPGVLAGPFADAFFQDFFAWTEQAGATMPVRHKDTAHYIIP